MKICKPYACILACLIITAAAARPVAAQGGGADPLRDLRVKSSLTADELTTVDRHLDRLIGDLLAEPGSARLSKRFRERLVRDYNDGFNTPAFRQSFVSRCAAKCSDALRNEPASAVLPLLYGLSDLGDPGTVPALKEASNSPDPGLRVLAVRALKSMKPKLEGDPAATTDVIRWLTELGKREMDDTILGLVYGAMSFSIQQDLQHAALVDILEARLSRHKNNKVSGYSAAQIGLQRITQLSPATGDSDKNRLVGVLAKYLTYYTHAYLYADLSPEARADLHRLIRTAERTLAALTGSASSNPGIASAISSAGKDRYAQIRAALESWVGSKDQPGQLNRSPWQVPAGAVAELDFNAPVPLHPDDPVAEPE